MRSLVITLLLILPFLLQGQSKFEYQKRTDLTFKERVALGEEHFDKYSREKGNGYKQFKRWKTWAKRALDENGYVISKGQATRRINNFNEKYSIASNYKSLSAGTMTELGPRSTTITTSHSSALGRLLSIAVANDNTFNHVIVASDGGGVWKTLDGGTNWTPTFETQTNMEVLSVEISHANSQHYFAGLLETGILRSTNGGTTWTPSTGIGEFESIDQIKVHPTDASIVFAISGDFGLLYKSTDGGATFSVLHNFGNGLLDLEFKPGAPETMYLSGSGGVQRSINSGVTWSTVTGAFVANGPTMMAVSPADANTVLALQAGEDGGFHALFRSTNSGASFVLISDDSNNDNNLLGYDASTKGGQAPRDMDIVISPTDINTIHVGGIDTYKSSNGGTTWIQTSTWVYEVGGLIPFIHADQDALYYITRGGTSRLYAANDGGIYFSSDGAASFTDITAGLGIRDFYRIDVSATVQDWVQGGSQDNGTSVLRSDGNWYEWRGADGGSVLIDHSDHNYMWATQNGGTLEITTDGGNSVANDIFPGTKDGSFFFPVFQHPTIASTIYVGTDATIYKSIDRGSNWTTYPNFPQVGSITYADIAPTDGNIIYVGTEDGKVYSTTNDGASWNNISPSSIGEFAAINWIAIHPTISNRIAIALSGASNNQYYMESTDGGANWTNITSNLPDLPAQCIVYEGDADDGIYVGMTPGLFYKNNSSTQWTNVGMTHGLPNTSVVDLEVAHNNLYIATYGRGLWKSALSSGSVANCELSNINSTPTFACANGMKTATITWSGNDASVNFNGGSGATPTSISAATGNSATFTYSPNQAFFSLNLTDSDGLCTWNYSGSNGTNCSSNACTTSGGNTCGNTGHTNISGLYNNGTSSTTYSHGNNGAVGRTVFLCGGQTFCSTGSTEGYGIDSDGSGAFFLAMGSDGVKSINFNSGGNCAENWANTDEVPTGVAYKNGRLFISSSSEIIELNPSTGTFEQFWDLTSTISTAGIVARLEDGPGNLLYFSDYNMTAGGFGTFDIVTGTATMLSGNMGSMIKRAVGMEYANGWLLAAERGEPGMGQGKIWAVDPANPMTPTEIASGFNDIFDVDYTTANGGNVLVADGGDGVIKNFSCSLVANPPSTCPLAYSLTNGNRITGTSTANSTYETDGVIESIQLIVSPHEVNYNSKVSIELFQDFQVAFGALMTAQIDGCGISN